MVQEQAESHFDVLVGQMSEREGVTEQLKGENQMLWVGQIKTFGFAVKSKLQKNPNFYS